MEVDCKIFEAVGGTNSSAAITTLYNSTQSAECVCHVHSVCMFCHFIGATSESKTQIHPPKCSTCETRRSFHGWRRWHATLGLSCWLPFSFPVFHCHRDQTINSYRDDIIMTRCIKWPWKKTSVLPLFHFTPCQTQTCYTGEACCHMCFVHLSVLC